MELVMQQVKDSNDASATHQRHGEKCHVTVFCQLVEVLELRIVGCSLWDSYRVTVFRHPSRDTLSDAKFQAANNPGMRVLRGPKDEFVAFEHVDQTGIAPHERGGKLNNAAQNLVESVTRAQADTDFVQHLN